MTHQILDFIQFSDTIFICPGQNVEIRILHYFAKTQPFCLLSQIPGFTSHVGLFLGYLLLALLCKANVHKSTERALLLKKIPQLLTLGTKCSFLYAATFLCHLLVSKQTRLDLLKHLEKVDF